MRVRSFLLPCLGIGLSLWVLPDAQGQSTCVLTGPTNGSTITAPGSLVATASVSVPTGDAIASVNFLANGATVANLIAPPYSVALNVFSPGTLTLQAILMDTNGISTPSDTVAVTVGGVAATNTFTGATNLVLWLEAGTGVTTNASGSVTEWDDQSTNRNNAVTNGAAPTWVPDAINGQPAIAFDAALTNYLQVADSSSIAITNDIAGFAVIAVPSAGWADLPMIWMNGGGAGNCPDVPSPNGLHLSATGQPVFERADGYNCGNRHDRFTASNPLSTSGYSIVCFNVTNGTMTQYLNGTFNGAYLANYNGLYADEAQEPLYIGASGDFDAFLTGSIAELMIFNSSLAEANLTNITAYLETKYFISAALPDPGPAVSILSPINGAAVAGLTNFIVTVEATNIAATGIAAVELFTIVNGTTNSLGVLTNSPYKWTVYAGSPAPITLMVTATDNQGMPNIATGTVSVAGPLGETCILTSPTSSSNFVAPCSISAIADIKMALRDTVASVDFYANGALLARLTAPPYSLILNLVNPGTLTLQAVLTDNLGYVTPSDPVTMIVGGVPAVNSFESASNLVLWLDAGAHEVSTNSNGSFNEWIDQSPYQNNAYSPGSAPTWLPDATYNQPAIAFDAANTNYLEVSETPSLAITGDISGFAVINVPAANWADEPMIWFEGGDGGNFGFANGIPSPNGFYISETGQPVLVRGDGTNDYNPDGVFFIDEDVFIGNNPLPASGYSIVGFSVTNGSMTQWLNGAPNGAYTAQYSSLYADNDHQGLFIGARGNFDNTFLTGDIAELMIFDSSLSKANLTNITAYLATKYGFIAVAAPDPGPTISIVTPTNGTGAGASFVVTADVTPATNAGVATSIIWAELFANGGLVGTLTNLPWQWTMSADFTAPPITLMAVAADNQGASNTSPITTVFDPGDLVRNGGFETGTLTNWTVSGGYYYAGGENGSAVYCQTGGHTGSYDLADGSYVPSYISQTLATTPGVTYQISCWYNNPNTEGYPTGFLESWNGDGLLELGNYFTTGWTNIVCQAIATTNSTVLEFGFYNPAYYSYLDDIVVVPAPIMSVALQSNAVILTWPQSFSGSLQSTTNLVGPWTTVVGVVTNQITITPSLAQQFYRLVWP